MYNKNEILDRLNFFRNRVEELGGFTEEIVSSIRTKNGQPVSLENEIVTVDRAHSAL